jgi:hypothetical protein
MTLDTRKNMLLTLRCQIATRVPHSVVAHHVCCMFQQNGVLTKDSVLTNAIVQRLCEPMTSTNQTEVNDCDYATQVCIEVERMCADDAAAADVVSGLREGVASCLERYDCPYLASRARGTAPPIVMPPSIVAAQSFPTNAVSIPEDVRAWFLRNVAAAARVRQM